MVSRGFFEAWRTRHEIVGDMEENKVPGRCKRPEDEIAIAGVPKKCNCRSCFGASAAATNLVLVRIALNPAVLR
jgi:hypothetical protein